MMARTLLTTSANCEICSMPSIRPKKTAGLTIIKMVVMVATGEFLALLNNDLLLEPGWLEPMLHVLLSPTLNAGLAEFCKTAWLMAASTMPGCGSTPMPSLATYKPWSKMHPSTPRRWR